MRSVALAVMLVALGARPLHAQAGEILGTWRGTSICVKADWNSACNDEQVIYHITAVPGRPDSVAIDAQKLVGGKPESMGIITVGRDSAASTWSGEWSNARYHLHWKFVINGKTLTGTLFVLPERRVARNISVRKD